MKLPSKFRIGSKGHKAFEAAFKKMDSHATDKIEWVELCDFFGMDASGLEGLIQACGPYAPRGTGQGLR